VENNVKRNRSPKWTPTIFFFLVWLGASVTPLSAQSPSANQVWDQLQTWFMTADNDGFTQYQYMVGWLNKGGSGYGFSGNLSAGSSYLIVGVCDNDCADVDLTLEDKDDVVIARDTAADDLPVIRFTPSTTANYWVKVTMPDCRSVDTCGFGIGIFVK
jgi:hypothetical protein